MKKIYILIILFVSVTFVSCDDWLDVKGKTEIKEKDMFSSKQGFCDALTGCYMSMAETNVYGKSLTMSDIESLANLWYVDKKNIPTQYYLAIHDYEEDNAKGAIKRIYSGLFNVIAQANTIISNINKYGDKIGDKKIKSVIEGEAYAIRAYCQFDILRLFGDMPQNSTIKVQLPYSQEASIDNLPTYYSYNEYVEKLKADVDKALLSLKDSDPILNYAYKDINKAEDVKDDFLYFRQSRLNYWAVMALKSRINLYIGNKDVAHDIALEIINAKDKKGNSIISLSSLKDINDKFYSSPNEALFYLSKYDLASYSNNLFAGDNSQVNFMINLVISNEMLKELFNGVETSSNNRYNNLWNKSITDLYGNLYAALKKYCYDKDKGTLNNKLIPLVRMSELYLIAIETTKDLAEANSFYKEYMEDHSILLDKDRFSDLSEIQDVIVDEYRREFFAEGFMFYVYKRLGKDKMLWNKENITEKDYILPLPVTEFNPNEIKK